MYSVDHLCVFVLRQSFITYQTELAKKCICMFVRVYIIYIIRWLISHVYLYHEKVGPLFVTTKIFLCVYMQWFKVVGSDMCAACTCTAVDSQHCFTYVILYNYVQW